MSQLLKQSPAIQVVLLLVAFFVLYFAISPSETNPLWRFPALLSGLPALLNNAVEFLLYEWWPIEFYNEEIEDTEETPLFKEITRSVSRGFLFGIEFIRDVLVGGVKTIVAFTSWDFVQENAWAKWPALPWTVVTAGVTILGYVLGGRWLAVFVAAATIYVAVFGQWEPAMETLSFVLVAAPVSVLLGLGLGILAYKSRAVETALMPLLNVAQTMPAFSYLVPVTVLFGVGDHAGAIATIVFATPPMIRLTLLGLKGVPPEVVDAGLMNGCGKLQLLFRVLIPSSRHNILIGVNQVIMQCLAMAVIASFIGAKGLGFNLLLALNGLRIGQALELGICIVLIAVVLDRLSLAWANKQIDYFADLSFFQRHKFALIFIGILVFGSLLAYVGSFLFGDINYLYLIPHNKGITTENLWQSGVDWMVENWYQGLQIFNRFFITSILVPIKTAYLGMPVVATFLLVMGAGFIVGGIRSALIVGGFLLFIALTDWWDRALITAYLTSVAVISAVVIGGIIGAVCAQNATTSRAILLVCDTLQTFPSFIYLIPVIMLFGVTDTSVVIAVVIYSIIPPIRYTVEGLRNVPQSLQDAASMSGVNRFQRLFKVELPLALPHIMLGLNQTVMFALMMVIIAAMIGTDDLGQLILKSLSDKNGIGNGLLLGLCVAFIGLIIDHLIHRWARERRAILGLD